mmetsp:Transcript_104593/g.207701  ORF Transcript_104593/g.207701 Transcript_104593/m.207701 type:complete len:303 (+) Transcript_104593:47-955(+)
MGVAARWNHGTHEMAFGRFMLVAFFFTPCFGGLLQAPGGSSINPACVIRAANGETVDVELAADAMSSSCRRTAVQPSDINLQIYAADAHWESPQPITSFKADWVVPELPARNARQVVYFWPGLKSQRPEMGYPVLQPVLMFGQHYRNNPGWELQSWFVDGRSFWYSTVTSPPIKVRPGDRITSSMALSPDGRTWTIAGCDLTSGENSTLNIAFRRAGKCNYTFAMLVNENINVNTHCDLMPASSSLTFSGIEVNGIRPQWTMRANCAGDMRCNCGNNATVDTASGNVTLKWESHATSSEVLV